MRRRHQSRNHTRRKRQDANHLECFGNERGGVDQFDCATKFVGLAKRVDNRTDPGGIDVGKGFKIENQENMSAGQGLLKRSFKLTDSLSASQTGLSI